MIGPVGKFAAAFSFAGLVIASTAYIARAQETALEVVTVDLAGYRFDLPLSPILKISDLKRDVVF